MGQPSLSMASRQSKEEHCSDYFTILKKTYPSETVSIRADILSDNPAGTMFVVVLMVALPVPLFAQTGAPPWPQMDYSSCRQMSQPMDPSQRTWKRGQPERDDYNSLVELLRSKNYRAAADGSASFVTKYPDSDFRDPALFLEMACLGYLDDRIGEARVAEQMVQLPLAEPVTRELGFVQLAGALSVYVTPDDPSKEQKLVDLESWIRCAQAAESANVRTPSVSQDAFENMRREPESAMNRTTGFVALMRQQYDVADSNLQIAKKLNPQNAVTYLWLFEAKSLSPNPDLDAGIFYLARFTELAPQVTQAPQTLKQMYVIVHGSDKGLSEVRALARTSTDPPPGFSVLRQQKQKHNYGNVVAASAIFGLLAYALVKNPAIAQGVASALSGSAASSKIMIFGGRDHRTYLGCLSCSEYESDSVFNEYGQNGSRYASESIWNDYGDFGSLRSEYSACNPYASDPPVIVDQEGTAYGRLTVNRLDPNIGAGRNFYNWLATAVCHK
jgi:hypothetical protein